MATRTIENCRLHKQVSVHCGSVNGKCNGYTYYGFSQVCENCKLYKNYIPHCKKCGEIITEGETGTKQYCFNCLKKGWDGQKHKSQSQNKKNQQEYMKDYYKKNLNIQKEYHKNYWLSHKRNFDNLGPIELCKMVLNGKIKKYPDGYWTNSDSRKKALSILNFLFDSSEEITLISLKQKKLYGMVFFQFDSKVTLVVEAFENYLKNKKKTGRKALDLTGQKFGKLTVIKRVKGKDKKNSYWLCKCDCGNEKVFAGSTLKNGDAVSCGCYNNQLKTERYKDITGQRFGKLTAIKRVKGSLWECKCDCGNTCNVLANNLGRTTISCGCNKVKKVVEDCVDNTRLRNLTAKKRERINKDSGVKGVVWDNSKQKWKAQIGFKGKNIFLGRYDNINEAILVRKQAEEKYFKPILEKYNKQEE